MVIFKSLTWVRWRDGLDTTKTIWYNFSKISLVNVTPTPPVKLSDLCVFICDLSVKTSHLPANESVPPAFILLHCTWSRVGGQRPLQGDSLCSPSSPWRHGAGSQDCCGSRRLQGGESVAQAAGADTDHRETRRGCGWDVHLLFGEFLLQTHNLKKKFQEFTHKQGR